eukprot:Sspe_Gene.10629::Locus_3558_Transcript_1_2_Confidence_0.500_Length_2102::g.10629::m.10629
MQGNPWFHPVANSAHQEFPTRLFIFPFAGGNPAEFQIDSIASLKVDSFALSYPGRGKRIKEKNIEDLDQLVSALAEVMLPHLDVPFAFLGYSMGALVAFELSRHLEQHHSRKPHVLFVVADEAPQTQKAFIDTTLSDKDFAKELGDLGLTAQDVLANDEMLQMVLPSIKTDMHIENSYTFRADPRLTTPIVAVCGTRDRWVDEEKMKPWKETTTAEFELAMIPGATHIFLDNTEHTAQLRAVMQKWLLRTGMCQRLPRGKEEAKEVKRVSDAASAKLIGNCWVRWDAAAQAPQKKPSVIDPAKLGLGAWFADVKDDLLLRGYSDLIDPAWGQ